jgi:two-component system sensor histidine kinase GlrK
MLAWLASGLILAALGLSVWLSLQLARPIKQLERVIRRLGRGDYSESVQIRGPRDLEEVGARLDWLRRQLHEAEQQKSRFLRHVSHELKTPLTAIREGSELLRDQVPGPLNEAQTEVAEIMRDNSLRLQRLIEDLLSFTVDGRPSQELTRRPVRLEQLAQRVVTDQKLALAAKSVQVRCALTPVTLAGDEEKLRLILDNLLSNAVKHSPRGGLIELRVKRLDDKVSIDVCDHGPGIAKDEQEMVFEAFYQGRARATGHVNGTGLGLAISREYASAHGGSIRVVASLRGAHLQVQLPLRAQPA